jgi:hypothetical protein
MYLVYFKIYKTFICNQKKQQYKPGTHASFWLILNYTLRQLMVAAVPVGNSSGDSDASGSLFFLRISGSLLEYLLPSLF